MASAQAVYLRSGEQTRNFQWGNPASNGATATGASNPIYKEGVYSTFQFSLTSATPGALTGNLVIQCSNDDNTGRGFILGGTGNAPGFAATTNTGNAVVTAIAGGIFLPTLVGALVSSPNVPAGTTVATVAATGLTLTLSSGVGVTAGTAPMTLFAQNWCATPLLTIALSGTTTTASPVLNDGGTTMAPWRYVRANLTALTGTGATIYAWMGV